MKIAVMAAGGVGGYFGARLAAAGEEVHFIARGAHLQALRTNGLTVKSANGDLHLKPVAVTDDPAQIGRANIVIFAVKQYDTEAAAKAITPLIGPDTGVISVQNGIEQYEHLCAVAGADHVLGGTVYIPTSIESPGVIKHVGSIARFIFGEFDGRTSPRAEQFLAACKNAGIDAVLALDINKQIWAKFAMQAAYSGVSSVIRKPLGAILGDPDTRMLFSDAIAEAATVAKAKGVDLGTDYLARQMALLDSISPETTSSMQTDLDHGRRLELAWLSGTIAHLGDELGVPTPTHHFICAALKLYANGRS